MNPTPNLFEQILKRMINETREELYQEAINGKPTSLVFPPQTLAAVKGFMTEQGIEADQLIPMAIETLRGEQLMRGLRDADQLARDSDFFEWPTKQPLYCVTLAFLQIYLDRFEQKFGFRISPDKLEHASLQVGPVTV